MSTVGADGYYKWRRRGGGSVAIRLTGFDASIASDGPSADRGQSVFHYLHYVGSIEIQLFRYIRS